MLETIRPAGPAVTLTSGLIAIAAVLLLSLGCHQAGLRSEVGALQFPQPYGARRPQTVGLGLVELVALSSVLGLRAQIVEMLGGQPASDRALVACRTPVCFVLL